MATTERAMDRRKLVGRALLGGLVTAGMTGGTAEAAPARPTGAVLAASRLAGGDLIVGPNGMCVRVSSVAKSGSSAMAVRVSAWSAGGGSSVLRLSRSQQVVVLARGVDDSVLAMPSSAPSTAGAKIESAAPALNLKAVVQMTQRQYDALAKPDANTLYMITDG